MGGMRAIICSFKGHLLQLQADCPIDGAKIWECKRCGKPQILTSKNDTADFSGVRLKNKVKEPGSDNEQDRSDTRRNQKV